MSNLTPDQSHAISATGDVLVMAGAGTGKTRTLVERCLAATTGSDPITSLDRVLMVTFTDAAAAEMRRRIRTRLESMVAAQPEDHGLAEQLALVDTARISTLHSFCLRLVRDHFHDLEIDPGLTVLGEEQAVLLAGETLDRLMARCYRGDWGRASLLQQLVLEHGRGWDRPVRDLILRLDRYTQTLRDPCRWFTCQLALLEQPTPAHWESWLRDGFLEWRNQWMPVLNGQPTENTVARRCADLLQALNDIPERPTIAAVLESIAAADTGLWPKRAKTRLRKPLEKFFEEALFLQSIAQETDAGVVDPLIEDWQWVRDKMRGLLELTRQFGIEYGAAKRELGAVDFHDLEQFALDLLWDRANDTPTIIAEQWRERLDCVFVDEYQDINEAQDTILRAVSRDQPASNRFLVGDVKQSIYRFRLANPRIFQGYAKAWNAGAPHRQVLRLTDNFRSHEGILDFVNRCFTSLMRDDLGGVSCDVTQQLQFGSPSTRAPLRINPNSTPPVEFHLLLQHNTAEEHAEATDPESPDDMTGAEIEALRVGLRLRRLKTDRFQVWDSHSDSLRDVQWRDMAILLRSPSGKAEVYAKVFERLDLPLSVARAGFFDSIEIADLLSLLQVMDNPLQDLPLLAVLRSPIVGLTPDELAVIRVANRSGYFWTALRRYHRTSRVNGTTTARQPGAPVEPGQGAWPKVDRFLKTIQQWRRRARQEPLSACLELILDETGYEAWLAQASRGTQRLANVRRLLVLTRQFDQFQRQGLFRFLRFVQAQRDAGLDAEPASAAGGESIRLLSIHQSKGLEFPVVVVADLGKPWNLRDLSGPIILDERFGLCPQVQPPHTNQGYPSLPYWLARRRQRRETLGEELRLFYVAATRACDLLVLVGTARHKTVTDLWIAGEPGSVPVSRLLSARSCLDWLGAWLPSATGWNDWTMSGQCAWLQWTVHSIDSVTAIPDNQNASAQTAPLPETSATPTPLAPNSIERLSWCYPHQSATRQPAKSSVSALRASALDPDDDPWPLLPAAMEPSETLSGADRGTACHRFLQLVRLDTAHCPDALHAEADRLCRKGILSEAEVAVLDMDRIAAFWGSTIGGRIRAQTNGVRRELPFTARFDLEELDALGVSIRTGPDGGVEQPGEWMVVQGVVDLAVVLPDQVWILDYKTDRVDAAGLEHKTAVYRPQLSLYAHALSRIYGRPVTQRWLHFLTPGLTVTVSSPEPHGMT